MINAQFFCDPIWFEADFLEHIFDRGWKRIAMQQIMTYLEFVLIKINCPIVHGLFDELISCTVCVFFFAVGVNILLLCLSYDITYGVK